MDQGNHPAFTIYNRSFQLDSMTFTFAHFSDIHLPLGPGLPRPLSLLIGKRAFSYLSWQRKRRYIHLPQVTERLIADIRGQKIGHLAITGDLMNLSLPSEFQAAARWLKALDAPDNITLVPGNHDTLVPVPWAKGLSQWQDFLAGDDGSTDFPTLTRREDVALIGLNSAISTPFFMSGGRLGQEQILQTEELLTRLGEQNICRIILLHHPPGPGIKARKALFDRMKFREMIARTGAELILHGHTHKARMDVLDGPKHPVPVLAVPSASATDDRHKHHARWHHITAQRCGDGYEFDIMVRGLPDPTKDFETEGQFRLVSGQVSGQVAGMVT